MRVWSACWRCGRRSLGFISSVAAIGFGLRFSCGAGRRPTLGSQAVDAVAEFTNELGELIGIGLVGHFLGEGAPSLGWWRGWYGRFSVLRHCYTFLGIVRKCHEWSDAGTGLRLLRSGLYLCLLRLSR